MSPIDLPRIVDELERLSIEHSRAQFETVEGEITANFGLLLADAMIYAIGFISIIIGLADIALSINPTEWLWSEGDLILLCSGVALWVCSQSLNDFKRLLPLWLRMVLKLGIGPKDFSDQSEAAQKRRAATLVIASLLSAIIGWRISVLPDTIATRIGIDFHIVIYAVSAGLLFLSMYWNRLIGEGSDIEQFNR
ncbi:MAG: hypothetical protein CXT67_01865 [Methanobacteriota archaeon]|jgi:hypothetical protein|nr:MAG: hypothetical protein CXT67_01865 [Euryarchaeota archaeon]HIG20392.1 hypothetical protein [Candidatus Poseidoniales archaeon]